MKALRYFGLTIVGVLVLLLLISFVLPSKIHMEKSKTMKASASIIYDQVNTTKNWENWSPWHKKDPNITLTYAGPAAGVGASYSWKGNKEVGEGTTTIKASEPDKKITTQMVFGDQGIANADFILTPIPGGTNVLWTFDCDMGMNPIGRYMGLFMDKFLGPDYEAGLTNLDHVSDSISKATPVAPAIEVVTVELTEKPYLGVTVKTSTKEIAENLGKIYGKIGAIMKKQGLQMAGAPMAFYLTYSDTGKFEMQGACVVNKAGKSDGEVKAGTIAKGTAVVANYYGPYEGTGQAHNAIDSWLKSNNKVADGAPWEEYVTDPMTEKDSSKWLTKVYYRIKDAK